MTVSDLSNAAETMRRVNLLIESFIKRNAKELAWPEATNQFTGLLDTIMEIESASVAASEPATGRWGELLRKHGAE